MSLSAHLLTRAASIAAEEAAGRLRIDPWTASKLAPVAASLLLTGLKRRTTTLFGAVALSCYLNCYREDLLANRNRFGAADIRARGEAIIVRTLGRHRNRAQRALAELGAITPRQSAVLFSMVAAAVISALSETRRDLSLNAVQLQGVLKTEAARLDGADPALVATVSDWVFRPLWPAKVWVRMREQLVSGAHRVRLARQPAE